MGPELKGPLESNWEGTLAWMEEKDATFGPLHVPWNSQSGSMWMLEGDAHLAHRLLFSKTVEHEIALKRLEEKNVELATMKAQYDLATSMLQKEWEDGDTPVHSPAPSPRTFLQPTSKAPGPPPPPHGMVPPSGAPSSSHMAPAPWLAGMGIGN